MSGCRQRWSRLGDPSPQPMKFCCELGPEGTDCWAWEATLGLFVLSLVGTRMPGLAVTPTHPVPQPVQGQPGPRQPEAPSLMPCPSPFQCRSWGLSRPTPLFSHEP